MRVFTPEHQIAAWQAAFEDEAVKRRKAEAERDRLKKALSESCEDNRREYAATLDCASPCPIGGRIIELEAERDELRSFLRAAIAFIEDEEGPTIEGITLAGSGVHFDVRAARAMLREGK